MKNTIYRKSVGVYEMERVVWQVTCSLQRKRVNLEKHIISCTLYRKKMCGDAGLVRSRRCRRSDEAALASRATVTHSLNRRCLLCSLVIAPVSIGPVCSECPVGVAHVRRRARKIARANAQACAPPLTRLRR